MKAFQWYSSLEIIRLRYYNIILYYYMGLVATKPIFGVSSKRDSNQFPQLEMFRDDAFQNAKNKGADQSASMRRLVCAFVVRKPPKTGFLALRPIFYNAVPL